MKRMRIFLTAAFLAGSTMPHQASSSVVSLTTPAGEEVSFNVGGDEPFLEVVDRIVACCSCEGAELESAKNDPALQSLRLSTMFDFEVSHAGITMRAKKKTWRDYGESVGKEEKKDIKYIIKTLANDSLISIGASRSSLKRAGDRIDHLHPFRFLMTVFRDEELKAGAHAIRDRGGWTWDGFIDGITGSLKEEDARGNLLQHVPDFAKKVKLEPSQFLPALEKGKYSQFVNILIDEIPREIDPNRYDM